MYVCICISTLQYFALVFRLLKNYTVVHCKGVQVSMVNKNTIRNLTNSGSSF